MGLAGPAGAQGDTGFLSDPGRTSLGLSFSRDTIDEYRLGSVAEPLSGEIERDSLALYAAYGVRQDLELWLDAAYASHDADVSLGVEDERGLQDLYLGLRWRCARIRRGEGVLSFVLAPAVKVPLSDYDTDAVTSIGDGQAVLLARFVVQVLHDAGPFVAFESGYDVRLEDPDDEVPLNLTLGFTVGRLTLTPFYSRVESLGGETLTAVGGGQGMGMGGGTSFAALEEDSETIGVGAYLRLTADLGLTASYRESADGSNTGIGDGLSVGVVAGW